jgi:hypothetical protein
VEDERLQREKFWWGVSEAISAFCTNMMMGGGQSGKGSGQRW